MPAKGLFDYLTRLNLSSFLSKLAGAYCAYGDWLSAKINDCSSRCKTGSGMQTIYGSLRSDRTHSDATSIDETAKEVSADAALILAASSENVATVVLTALFYLARDTKLLDRLTRSVSGCANLTENQESGAIITAIVNESLRMNPPVPGALFRELESDVCFDDVHLPRGTLVGVSAYVLHHDEKNFERPEAFLPDRWLNEGSRCTKEAFCPFGYGVRDCVGKKLAFDVTCQILEQFVSQLEWKPSSYCRQTKLRCEDFFVSYPAEVEAQIRKRRNPPC